MATLSDKKKFHALKKNLDQPIKNGHSQRNSHLVELKKLCMWFVELFSCCSKPVLPGSAWVLLNHVLQTLFLSSAIFCLTLYLNLYRAIGCGLYIKSLIQPPAFIACKTVPLCKVGRTSFVETHLTSMMVVEMKNILLVLSFTVGCISALQCDAPGQCVGQLIGFTSQNSSTECLSTCKGNTSIHKDLAA